MSRVRARSITIALWLVFAFVTWNVVFDRAVTVAAVSFTREQIARYQQGQPVSSIDEAFRPHVRAAALRASGYAAAVLLVGAALLMLTPTTPRDTRDQDVRDLGGLRTK